MDLVRAQSRAMHSQEADQGQKLWAQNFTWLVRLRWVAVLSQAATVIVVRYLGMELDARRLYALVGLALGSNIACALWVRRNPNVREWMLAAIMAFDFIELTALLHASGGPSNPFTVLFLVHIALAAVVLKATYAWSLAAMAMGCFFALFVLPGGNATSAMHHHMGHHQDSAMTLHLQGMWVAFAIAAAVIAYFVTRVTRDLEIQRNEVALARTRALRSERLASLATLAAGAAHELATPLSTIAVAAKELERELSLQPEAKDSTQDARLIRDEVQRCRHILDQMASDAGESAGEAFRSVSPQELLQEATEDLAELSRVKLEIQTATHVRVPLRALGRALRGLVRNALQASSAVVEVRAKEHSQALLLEIEDHGSGMSADLLTKVGEPFFTTKEPGHGMGLGVFLARALCERLGGSLELSSKPGQGTLARVLLPQGEALRKSLQQP
jgi:two-component system sensor histidine kinase RegB